MGRPTDPNFWQQSPPPQTGDMNNERTLNQRFMRELPGALPPQDVIIHDGAISGFESAALIVDTEGEAAADELNVINIVLSANENLHPGMIITLRAKDQARTVTVKNSAAANGINTADGHDVVLSTEWDFVLRLVAGRWYEIQTRGDVRASDAQTDASTALARTTPATTTSRGIGRVATLADMEPGAEVTDGPAFLSAKGGVITPTPTPHGIPQADASGRINTGWIEAMLYNTREVLTTSGTWTASVTGWHKITCIGGGGGGGSSSSRGGTGGGTTTFSSLSAIGGGGGGGTDNAGCGGGGAGQVQIDYFYITLGTNVPYTIGAGGGIGSGSPTGYGAGKNNTEAFQAGTGAYGAGNGGAISGGSNGAPIGGAGGINGTGYGGGGGGAAGSYVFTQNVSGGSAGDGGQYGSRLDGGSGGSGALIIEYFDPAKVA